MRPKPQKKVSMTGKGAVKKEDNEDGLQMGSDALMPDYVYIAEADDCFRKMPYMEFKEHERKAIARQIGELIRLGRTCAEVEAFEWAAINEWNRIKSILRKEPDAVLVLNVDTGRYIPIEESLP